MIVNQRLKQHFETLGGTTYRTVPDAIKGGLVAQGYSGTVNDMLKAYFADLGFGKTNTAGFKKLVDELSDVLYPNLVSYYPVTNSLKDFLGGTAATFTRSTVATYINKETGLVTVAAINEPRFEAQGLLMEEARINQCPYYSPFGGGGWGGSGITFEASSVEAMPGFSSSASKATFVANTGADYIAAIFTSADSAVGTGSLWIASSASSAGKTIDLALYDTTAAAVLGITTVTLTVNPQRVQITGTATTAGNGMVLAAGNLDAFGGTSNLDIGDVVYVDGAQYETGLGATSNILTAGSALQRTADSLILPAAAYPAYTADSTIAMTIVPMVDPDAYHGLWAVAGETSREADIDSATQKLLHFIPSTVASSGSVLAHGTPTRYVCTYDADGNWIAYLDGTQDDTAAVGSISGTITGLYVGGNGTLPLHGHVREVKTLNTIATAEQVATL